MMDQSNRPFWDHQFAETESERNARLRAKRLTRNETNEHNHAAQDDQPVTITTERYRQYQDAETERDQLRTYIASQREALAAMMLRQSLATGHGDTHADLLAELEPQIKELRDQLEAARAYAKHERDLGADECAQADAGTIQTLQADLAEAIDTLRPFALSYSASIPSLTDPTAQWYIGTWSDIERAHTIVEKHNKGDKQ